MSLPFEEKRHYVAVMPHTLHAVRTAGRTVEFCGECALPEKNRVQELLQAWSEDLAISGIVAIAPEPVWWQRVTPAETRTLQTDADVRRFVARLPHHLREPFEILACNATDGKGVAVDGDDHWLLGVTQGDALASAAAEAIERGIVTAALGSATLDSVAAVVTAVQRDGAGVVRLWAIGHRESYVFTVSVRGVEAIDRCATGFDAIFGAVQEVFGLGTAAEAAGLFFEKPADPAAAARLAAMIAPQLQRALNASSGADAPASFACTGLTGRESWFGRAIAQSMALPYWHPKLDRYLDHLELNLAPVPADEPSLSLLGTLHLAAIHTRRSAAWHPSWGLISRTSSSREIRRPVNVTVAPGPSPATGAVTGATTLVRPEALTGSPSFARVTPTKPPVPARAPAPLVGTPVAKLEAENKTAAPTTGSGAAAPVPSKSEPAREHRSPSAQPIAGMAFEVPDASERQAVQGGADPRPPPRTPSPPVSESGPIAVSPQRLPVTPRALPPVSSQPETARAHRRPPLEGNGDEKPAPPPWGPEDEGRPSSEPTVIVLRRTGYWPVVGMVLALFGAGVGVKFYVDAERVMAAAEKEKRAAELAQEKAEREVAAAVEQVRLASQQAARADVRARELAAASSRNAERTRSDTDTMRREAMEQARREAEEQTVRILARELAAARAATAPGILKIDSLPAGADVQVDGRSVQRTPVSIEGLLPGRHSVKLTLAGHVPRELTADIAASKTTDLGPIRLEAAIGALAVSSSPGESDFSIRPSSTPADAAPLRRGRTPARLDDLPAGEYAVQFNRAGWPERTERVSIEGGKTARVAATFQGGTVTINSSPTGAAVLQGGLLLGKAPLTLRDVPPQDVTYELIAPGYEPLKLSGTVAEGRALELNGTLMDLNRVVSAEEVRTPPRPQVTTPLDLGRVPRSTPPYITVSFVVLPDGSVQDVTILEAIDRKVARKSVDAIGKWRFSPGVSHAGYPVKVRMSMPVRLAGG